MSLYWKCQIAGWSVYGLIGAGIPVLYGGPRWEVVARAFVGALVGLILTDQLRRHMQRHGWIRLPLRRLAPRIVIASVVVAAMLVLAILPFLLRVFVDSDRTGATAAVFLSHVAITLGWILMYLGYHVLDRVRTVEAEKWRLQLAMRDTELRALRAQLNPHFLFNSLNSLRALVTEDAARAQEAITGLAALLRHTLQLNRVRTTTLERELDATRHYLELEALRFESRLRYQIDADEAALSHPVPPMMLQTLVENAIKHGIAQLPAGGIVRVEVWKAPDDLHVRVTNTGALKGSPEERGVGLANSLARLRLVFGEGATLELKQSTPHEVTCDVVLPFEGARHLSDIAERRRAS